MGVRTELFPSRVFIEDEGGRKRLVVVMDQQQVQVAFLAFCLGSPEFATHLESAIINNAEIVVMTPGWLEDDCDF